MDGGYISSIEYISSEVERLGLMATPACALRKVGLEG